jgi:hypothetical protein
VEKSFTRQLRWCGLGGLKEGRRFGWRFAGATIALAQLDHSPLDIAALPGARHWCSTKGRLHLLASYVVPERVKVSFRNLQISPPVSSILRKRDLERPSVHPSGSRAARRRRGGFLMLLLNVGPIESACVYMYVQLGIPTNCNGRSIRAHSKKTVG